MARPSKKAEAKKQTNSLLAALEFVANAQKNIGTPLQTHCIVKDGWCVASDNVLTMGAKVPDDLASCPQTARLIAALRRCEDNVSLTQLDEGRISVKSGKLKVVVPCVGFEAMTVLWADPAVAPLGPQFQAACAAISHLANDGGTAVHLSSLLGRGQTLSATTGRVLVEYWHGFDTPPYWVLPKPAITALMKCNKPLKALGFSGNSATFHFEDDSWLKTQLYEDKWPNIDRLFEKHSANTPVVDGFFAAIDVLADFAQPGDFITCKPDLLVLKDAEIAVKDLKGGVSFNLKDMQSISKLVVKFDYEKGEKAATFTSERLRGCISFRETYDDDIPF